MRKKRRTRVFGVASMAEAANQFTDPPDSIVCGSLVLTPHDLACVCFDVRQRVELRTRRQGRASFHHSCLGRQIVDATLEQAHATTHEDAVAVGTALLTLGHLRPLAGGAHNLLQDNQLFRFFVDEVESGGAEYEGPGPIGCAVELGDIAARMRAGVECRRRRWRLWTFDDCFVGRDAVTWLCAHGVCGDRLEAVKLGNLLRANGFLEHVVLEHTFRDDYLFYRWVDNGRSSHEPTLGDVLGAGAGISGVHVAVGKEGPDPDEGEVVDDDEGDEEEGEDDEGSGLESAPGRDIRAVVSEARRHSVVGQREARGMGIAPSVHAEYIEQVTATLSAEQRALWAALLPTIPNELKQRWARTGEDLDEPCLMRYCMAAHWDMALVQRAIRDTVGWREEQQLGSLTIGRVGQSVTSGALRCSSVDKTGRGVVVITPRLEAEPNNPDRVLLFVYTLERAAALTRSPDKRITVFVDCWGFSVKHAPSLAVARDVVYILQHHYTKRLGALFLVDAPTSFRLFWKCVSPLINASARKRIFFVHGSEQRRERIYEPFVDASALEPGLLSVNGKNIRSFDAAEYARTDPLAGRAAGL